MKITFLGAAKTVTGSCYLVETVAYKFLVDCGMFQGHSKENALNEETFAFNPSEIDFILLTHAHIDHSGRIPKVYKDGFRGDIYCTKATADLCRIMLPDSAHIQEFENEWNNRKRLRAGKPAVEPLYTMQDALDSLALFKSCSYTETIRVKDEVKVRFNDAGHILGSSIIEVWVTENGEQTKLVFSGDIGNRDMPILRDPTFIQDADYVIMESTYGNRLHKENRTKVERFVDIISETLETGGNVVIPSFAVGRTQEIIYDLNKQHASDDPRLQRLLNTPVIVDSPLAISATEVFRSNLDCYDEEAREYIRNGDNPLDFPGLQFTRTADESKALNEKKESMIIISASGMCEAGRIKHHLKHNLWRADSTILFVGYQAQGTLGRSLVDGAKKVKIFGEEITVKARVEMLEGFSGHADREGLLSWLSKFRRKPSKLFIVHGEETVMQDFAQSIKERFDIEPIIPSRGDSFILTPSCALECTDKKGKKMIHHRFKRLELVDLMERLKEEFEELTEIIKADLKQEKSDIELEETALKLKNLEKSIIEVLK